jgi:hypothetical protein
MLGGILPHCLVKEVQRNLGVICFADHGEPVLQDQFDFEFFHGPAFRADNLPETRRLPQPAWALRIAGLSGFSTLTQSRDGPDH